jgi:hypothetical protein
MLPPRRSASATTISSTCCSMHDVHQRAVARRHLAFRHLGDAFRRAGEETDDLHQVVLLVQGFLDHGGPLADAIDQHAVARNRPVARVRHAHAVGQHAEQADHSGDFEKFPADVGDLQHGEGQGGDGNRQMQRQHRPRPAVVQRPVVDALVEPEPGVDRQHDQGQQEGIPQH